MPADRIKDQYSRILERMDAIPSLHTADKVFQLLIELDTQLRAEFDAALQEKDREEKAQMRVALKEMFPTRESLERYSIRGLRLLSVTEYPMTTVAGRIAGRAIRNFSKDDKDALREWLYPAEGSFDASLTPSLRSTD